jgi:hypothetical protein
MTCKMRWYEKKDNEVIIIDYTCEEMRKIHLDLKRKWREINRTDEIIKKGMRDKPYENYCNEIDDFLLECRCDPEWTDLHFQEFGDNENKNIMIAKAKRKKGISNWNTKE